LVVGSNDGCDYSAEIIDPAQFEHDESVVDAQSYRGALDERRSEKRTTSEEEVGGCADEYAVLVLRRPP
jgi:hypothetical protein